MAVAVSEVEAEPPWVEHVQWCTRYELDLLRCGGRRCRLNYRQAASSVGVRFDGEGVGVHDQARASRRPVPLPSTEGHQTDESADDYDRRAEFAVADRPGFMALGLRLGETVACRAPFCLRLQPASC